MEPTDSALFLNGSFYEKDILFPTKYIPDGSFEVQIANGTNISSAEDVSFILPWWRQVLWSILFGGMVIVATGGNLIVIWIVMASKGMRTVTNFFIVNLSIADAMVSSLNVTFNYIYMLNYDWPFGLIYCKIASFVATLSISASVFTLMAIAFDRYRAIINPLKPRMGKRCTLAIAAAIWVISIILSCPNLLFFTTDEAIFAGTVRIVCYGKWPDGDTSHSFQEHIYNIVLMVLTYFLPMGSMTYTYARVGRELWRSPGIGEYCTWRQLENIKSKRRVVKMMMVVVVIFAVCWLPFHIYFIVTSYYPHINETPFIQEVYLAIYWLAMSNSMYNPIIYYWMNSRFRRGFRRFFCFFCPFVQIEPEALTRREFQASRYSCSGSPDHHRINRNDTQKSILYTCPGSPTVRKNQNNRRMQLMKHQDSVTEETVVGEASNQEMFSLNECTNTPPLQRSNSGHPQKKWTTRKSTVT